MATEIGMRSMATTHTSELSPPRYESTGPTIVATKSNATIEVAYANHLSCCRSVPAVVRNRKKTAGTGIRYTTKAKDDTYPSSVASGPSIACGFATVSGGAPREGVTDDAIGNSRVVSQLATTASAIVSTTNAAGRRQRGDGGRPVGNSMIARNRLPSAGIHAYPMSNTTSLSGRVPGQRINAAHSYASVANESWKNAPAHSSSQPTEWRGSLSTSRSPTPT